MNLIELEARLQIKQASNVTDQTDVYLSTMFNSALETPINKYHRMGRIHLHPC